MKSCALLLLVLAACAEGDASGNGVDDAGEVTDLPLGSFCLGADPATRICLDPAVVAVTVTESGSATHVRITATLQFEYEDPGLGIIEEERDIELQGQVPAELPLPQIAERVQLTYPAFGTCRYSRPTNPFGGACGKFDVPAICDASAYDDPARAALDLVVLDETRVGGRFTADLPFSMPQGDCENDSTCAGADAPEFTPEAALPGLGLFHLPLP